VLWRLSQWLEGWESRLIWCFELYGVLRFCLNIGHCFGEYHILTICLILPYKCKCRCGRGLHFT
jgi:hypothetical protein